MHGIIHESIDAAIERDTPSLDVYILFTLLLFLDKLNI